MNTKFWLNDIKVLYENKNYLIFFPNVKYSFIENLNAIIRFAFYYSFLCFIFTNNLDAFVPFVVICIITLMLYKTSDYIETFETKQKTKKIRNSTKNNPMMNLSISDYGKGDIGIANTEDKNVDKNLVNDLYKDIGDLSNKQCFERNFYTMPVTSVPNDQGAFANWLYKTDTCKSGNMDECVKNVDNRIDLGMGSL